MNIKNKIREVISVVYNHSNCYAGKLETIEIATNQILGFSKWQPIKSAPKDGAMVDLWHNQYGRITDTWWDDNHWVALSPDDQDFTYWMLPPIPPKH